MSRLFCFGLGYSAETLAKRLAAKGWSIAGTARDLANIERLRGEGYEVVRFTGEAGNAELVAALAGTTHLLHSIPPGPEGDPVLRHYRAEIARLPTLDWVGYLSTVGVYGNSAGAVVDESAQPHPNNERTRARVVAESAWLALGEEIGPACAGVSPRRHLRTWAERARQASRRNGAAHRQARAGVQPHPCRGHRERARSLDRAAAGGRHLQCRRRRAGAAGGRRHLCC